MTKENPGVRTGGGRAEFGDGLVLADVAGDVIARRLRLKQS